MDGDGVSDFFVADRDTNVYRVASGGWKLAQATFDDDAPSWNLQSTWFVDIEYPFVEQGHVGVFVDWGGVNVLDLGPVER